ncbi:MAG: hypothetical protein IJ418_22635 [Clostridia bacterium]|nr:hypothetical protein [Clostridia bacterium]
MSLFGRRKPGFSKEVELRPEDISEEFSDRNDPARQDANPKTEKKEMAAQAQAVMDGTAVSGTKKEEAPVDVFEYMESLPEVEDPFTPSEEPMIEDPNAEPDYTEMKPCEILANYIRERTKAVQLTPKKPLAEEEPQLDELLAEMKELESCADIRSVKGNKDEYFYSSDIMANNYAMIAMLVLEKDIARTVAHMVRFNCKTYPSPTPLYYFMRSPYNYTKPQLDQAWRVIQRTEDMKDIKIVDSFNGVSYLYSEDVMSFKYARALADNGEAGEADF